MPNGISSYYPAGQRIIESKGLEYNYDNFINEFGDKLYSNDLEILQSNNNENIGNLRKKRVGLFSICHVGFQVSLEILKSLAVLLVITIPFYYMIEQGGIIENIILFNLFIIYTLIVLIAFSVITVGFKIFETKFGMAITAIDL